MFFYRHWNGFVVAPIVMVYLAAVVLMVSFPHDATIVVPSVVVYVALWFTLMRRFRSRALLANRPEFVSRADGRRVPVFMRDGDGNRASNADLVAEIRRNGEADCEQQAAEYDEAGEADL